MVFFFFALCFRWKMGLIRVPVPSHIPPCFIEFWRFLDSGCPDDIISTQEL